MKKKINLLQEIRKTVIVMTKKTEIKANEESGSKDNNTETTKIYIREKNSAFRKKVANNLAVTRMFEGVSQSELAERLGTSKSSISRIEKGGQNLTLDYVNAYAEALGKQPVFMVQDPPVDYGQVNNYQLKLYDEVLMEFSMSRSSEFKIEIRSINEERRHLLPLDLEPTPEGVEKWLQHRSIPGNRDLAGDILTALGLTVDDLKGIVDICFGLSLNDSYWITQPAFEGKFDDYNLYENEFSNALSLVAYTGKYYSGVKRMRTSPELTTGGMLRKAWRFFGRDSIWLYKGGTEGFANAGMEPYSEYFASQIAKRMGINAVEYELENWKGILASKCRLFTNKYMSYIPIGRIVRTGGIQACLDYYRELGDEFYQQLADMLVFDAVILNEDRHYGNFGLLRNSLTGDIMAPAPVFDNGISLLCYAMKDDFENGIEKYIAEKSNPYGRGNDFVTLAKRVMGKRQKAMLRKLINFKFEESDVSNPPSWRIHALEELVQDRVRLLLEE